MDVVIRVPHIPVVGETILAQGQSLYGGGKGANQAIAASRLGGNVYDKCRNDAYGQKLHQELINSGVSVEGIEFDPKAHRSSLHIYVSDQGDNNIVVNPVPTTKLIKSD